MAKKFSKSIFIFRRDLRLQDNTGLIAAQDGSDQVTPIFIFDPRQVRDNEYKANKIVQFMVESLRELGGEIDALGGKLQFFFGQSDRVLDHLLNSEDFDAVFLNRDITPFARQRDLAIESVCKQHQRAFCAYDDVLLNGPGSILKKDGTPYTVYTFFMKRAIQDPVAEPVVNRQRNFSAKPLPGQWELDAKLLYGEKCETIFRKGGRKEAVGILKQIDSFEKYEDERNYPALERTTGLSAHHKFGTISVRESFHSVQAILGLDHCLIRELYWRDFFSHILWHFPHVLGSAFLEKFRTISWGNSTEWFQAWCSGQTGFPIVDAGMRELTTTGFMHNRVRMIVASFLMKDLQIDWRWGERFFAQHLIDYDPAVNNGNWQWAASTGCDAQPYFRIFNPWTQQKKFDAEALYIKRWVPELAELSAKEIHALENVSARRPSKYPAPIVEHAEARVVTRQMYEVV
jgi:deoxyribodipyrimidine photo-lyase